MWGLRFIRATASIGLVGALVACGGGSAGDSLFGDGSSSGTSSASTVEVIAGATTLGTASTESTTVTATVKDSSNAALSGVTIAWATSSGTLTNQVTTTDDSGVATATFSPGNDSTNRTATITVSSGSVSGKLNISLAGTTISVAGNTTLTQGATASLTVTVTDSVGTKLSNIPLTVSSSLGNGLSSTSLTSDTNGSATVTYTATNVGSDSLTVTGAGVTKTTTMTVNGAGSSITFLSPAASTDVNIGQTQQLTLQYTSNGVAQAGQTINVASTIGTLGASSVTTNASGQATVSISSTFAGSAVVTASLASDPTVQGTLPLRFVATTPGVLVLQLDTTALSPNPVGSTTYFTNVKAKVTDVNGNPVQGSTVIFSQTADPSGGQLSSATATTNSSGEATVKYYSGPSSTASGGVVIDAAVSGNSTVCSNVNSVCSAHLTVNGAALFITLGTGNELSNYDAQTYQKNWSATVTDANGVKVANQTLTIKVIPTYYRKGYLLWNSTDSSWENGISPLSCANEDLNLNGNLDSGEDVNQDGQLTPGNVVSLAANTVTTNSDGVATITLRYPESHAWWLSVKLTATAVVQGTESTRTATFPLDVLASDFNTQTIAPPGRYSPYGVDTTTCTNAN